MAISRTRRQPAFKILASGQGWHVQDLFRAASGLDITISCSLFQNLSHQINAPASDRVAVMAGVDRLDEMDAILVRMMPPASLERVIFRMDMLHRLHESGIPVINPPRTIEMAVDKALSLSRLATLGVSVPATWVGESPDDALLAFEQLGGDVVCKPIFGSEGKGLVRIQDREIAWRVFHALNHSGSVIYLQKFLKNPGYDYRAFFLNGQIIALMRRRSSGTDWRTNVSQGGKPESVGSIKPEMQTIVEKTARIMGGMILGIDVLEDSDGHLHVLEVNGVPGWRAISQVTGVDVPREWLLAAKATVNS